MRSIDVYPCFLSVGGTRRSTLRGEKEGPRVAISESQSEQEKASWLDDARMVRVVQVKKKGVWCKLKKRAEEMRSFELSGKKIFSKYDETRSKEEKNKKNWSKKNAHSGQSVRYKSWWKRGNIKIAVSEDHASCWVHKDLTVTTKQIHSSEGVGRKGRMSNTTANIEREYWMGTEIGRLGGYSFRGTVTAGDGCNQKGGKMGAGYVNLRGKKKR